MKRFLLVAIIIVLGFFVYSCSKPAHSETKVEKKEKEVVAVNIKIKPVSLSDLTEYITISGQTIANKDVTYSAEVPGRIEYLPVKLGQSVKRGQILARVDYEMSKAQADQAQASFDLAEKTYNRLLALKADELISQQQLDEANAGVIQAEAQLKIANANLRKSTIYSKISGVISAKLVEAGEYVAPGMPLFRVVDLNTILVTAQIPETEIVDVKKGFPVEVTLDALGVDVQGEVQSVIPTAHIPSKTFEARIKVNNPDHRILVGMSASVKIVSKEHKDVVVAMHDVIIEEEHQRSVFIEDNGVAKKKSVQLGATEGSRVILEDGLNPGEKLVVVGHRDLVDGQPVKVLEN